ncbi:MAG TPA: nicotinamidase [Planctomycetota bacterium]|nr:MAG: Isochorismatase family protein YecD [Planctomycetes bacterium ADurb.Bin069]HNR97965.1 nicotinamidase [Planctomycetota bacterium]HNU24509.1 nicotinamidase [Planctomycetota bacterium]HOE29101.1 nicotinamidase [Planctomycetota bacterium]HOE86022.1 nicotinamidase [Planctomycetota bacterium]
MGGGTIRPGAGDALILVDVQKDFLPGGSLAVPRGDEVVPVLNRYLAVFRSLALPVVATRDWHPPDHCSFKARGGPWPPHCVAGSEGARFAALLDLPAEGLIVSKGTARDKEAYSGFEGTDLDAWLKRAGVARVFVGGLATDYCVLNSVRDALGLGYGVFLLRDAARAVEAAPGDGEHAVQRMRRLGAATIEFSELGS